MEINQIAQLLEDIELKARKTIVEINGVYILKDDEPKYRALLALKDFLGRNESVIRELNVLAKAAGVETTEIMATYAAPEVTQKENIQVGLGDPTITAPTSEAIIEPIIPAEVSSDDLKKNSDDLEVGFSGATVGEPTGEEIMPELPKAREYVPVELDLGGEQIKVDPDEVGFAKEGFVPLVNDYGSDSVTPSQDRNTEGQNEYTYRAMTDEEIRESVAKIAVTDPTPITPNDSNNLGSNPDLSASAELGSPDLGAGTDPEPKPGEPETPEPDSDLKVESANPKRRKVVSRRLHNWRDKLSNDLFIIGALFFGKKVSNDSYGIICNKIGYLHAELAKGNEVTDSQVEDLHNSIVEADLTASEKKSLYKKLGRLDKKIEKFNARNSGEGRKRGR